ncbi:hypothetical protein PC119_g25110, partial [Phytophthora cactorum]
VSEYVSDDAGEGVESSSSFQKSYSDHLALREAFEDVAQTRGCKMQNDRISLYIAF